MRLFSKKDKSSKEKKSECCSQGESSCFSSKTSEKIAEECSCVNECEIKDIEKSRFIVLGACCRKSKDTLENVKTAVKEMGFTEEVINIGDNREIAKYALTETPSFIIDSRVVSSGKFLSVNDVKKIINSLGIK